MDRQGLPSRRRSNARLLRSVGGRLCVLLIGPHIRASNAWNTSSAPYVHPWDAHLIDLAESADIDSFVGFLSSLEDSERCIEYTTTISHHQNSGHALSFSFERVLRLPSSADGTHTPTLAVVRSVTFSCLRVCRSPGRVDAIFVSYTASIQGPNSYTHFFFFFFFFSFLFAPPLTYSESPRLFLTTPVPIGSSISLATI